MTQDKFYLVTYYGTPDWKSEKGGEPCTRRYLFSSEWKAAEFVMRRTFSEDWITPPAFPKGSMKSRLKKGSLNRYNIVTLTVDEINEEELTTDEVTK